jgi:hypothetical protein
MSAIAATLALDSLCRSVIDCSVVAGKAMFKPLKLLGCQVICRLKGLNKLQRINSMTNSSGSGFFYQRKSQYPLNCSGPLNLGFPTLPSD